jgi:hypothetical protein
MKGIVGWNTLRRGLPARARVLSVLMVTSCAASTLVPGALSAQSKPGVSEQTLTLNAGDGGQISLLGRSLTLFARAEVVSVDSGDPAEGIKASFARARGSSRTLTISTEPTVTPGEYTINVVSRIRRRTYTLDFTLTIEGDVAPVTTGLSRPTTATRPSRPQTTRPRPTSATRPSRPQATRPSRPQTTRPTAARNAPPRVITVTPPDEIQADLPFDLSVEAGDDKGLADLTVAWRGGRATASFSGSTDETVSVSLPGFAEGTQIVSVIVRDNEGKRGTARTVRLTVQSPAPIPPELSELSISTPSAEEGDVVEATVLLDAPAPTDIEVALAATSVGVVDIPSSVTIPTGMSEATFSVVVGAQDSDLSLGIIANYRDRKKDARLQILGPPSVSTFQVLGSKMEGDVAWVDKPGLVRGAGYLVLDRSASAAGTVVSISTDRPDLLTLPSEITVPAGETGLRFDIENKFTPSLVDVRVRVQAGGTTRTATYRLKPSPKAIPVQILFSSAGGPETSTISVIGGQIFTATVVFSRPVGPDGFNLYISGSGVEIQGGLRHLVPAGSDRFDVQVTSREVTVATIHNIRAEEEGSIIRVLAEVEVLPVPSQLESISFEPAWTLPGGPPVVATASFVEAAPIDRTVTLSGTLPRGMAWQKALTVPAGESQGQVLVTGLDDIQQSVATAAVEVTATFMESTAATTVSLHRTQQVDRVEMSSVSPFFGEEVTVTILLRDPAAPGGFELSLTGPGTGILSSPPQTVFVPAGETSVAVPLVSNGTGLGARTVELALRNELGPTFGFSFQLNPAPVLNAIVHSNALVAPLPLQGGTSGTVDLILAGDPSHPVSVSLVSSDPGVISVPTEVVVSAARTAIPVQAVLEPGPGETGTATITASFGGQEVSRSLTVISKDPFIVSMEVRPHSLTREMMFYPGEQFQIRVVVDRDLRPLGVEPTFVASEPDLLESLETGAASTQVILMGRLASVDEPRDLTITGSLGGAEKSVDVQVILPTLDDLQVYETGNPNLFLDELTFPLPYSKCALFVSIPRAIVRAGFVGPGFRVPLTVTTSRPDLMQVDGATSLGFGSSDAPAGVIRTNIDCNVAGSAALISEPTPITIDITVGGATISKTVTLHPEPSAVLQSVDFPIQQLQPGESGTAVVRLDRPASTTRVTTVDISSDDERVFFVPSTLQFGPGQIEKTVQVGVGDAAPVATVVTVTVTFSDGGTTVERTFDLLPRGLFQR